VMTVVETRPDPSAVGTMKSCHHRGVKDVSFATICKGVIVVINGPCAARDRSPFRSGAVWLPTRMAEGDMTPEMHHKTSRHNHARRARRYNRRRSRLRRPPASFRSWRRGGASKVNGKVLPFGATSQIIRPNELHRPRGQIRLETTVTADSGLCREKGIASGG